MYMFMKPTRVSRPRAAFIVALCFISLAAAVLVLDGAKANWIDMMWRNTPITDPLLVTVNSPVANATYNGGATLNFTVAKPASWWSNQEETGVKPYGSVTSIDYSVDGQKHNVYKDQDIIPYDGLPLVSNFSLALNDLCGGFHTLVLTVVSNSIYWVYPTPPPGYHGSWSSGPETKYYTTTVSNTVTFNVIAAPKIGILLEEKRISNAASFPLTFTVNGPASWMGYSLDGQGNVTVAGNTTLPELPIGIHTLTVYANDTTGNMGASEPASFEIVLPSTPSPTPMPPPTHSLPASPSPSDQQQASAPETTSPTPAPTAMELYLVIGVIAGAAALTTGVVVYKRKGREP
jgi:hypothetical protein